MTTPPPRRPWWRRKRWRLAVATWAALPPLYAFSIGPACYGVGRGWLRGDNQVAAAMYLPLIYLTESAGFGNRLRGYCGWWELHGELDAGKLTL